MPNILYTILFLVFGPLAAIFYLGCVIMPVLVLPIYISVFRSNRERDRESAVYPINYHFYRLVFVFYAKLICNGAISVTRNYVYDPSSHDPKVLQNASTLNSTTVIYLLILFNFSYTHQTLLSILAVQRFLLYFFRDLESFINFGIKNTTRLIYGIHVLCFLPIGVFCIIARIGISFDRTYVYDPILEMKVFNMMSYIANFLMVFSAILYIPMYISIFGIRHLPSVEKYKPQNYMIYQTVLLYAFKIMQIFSFLLLHYTGFLNLMNGYNLYFHLDFISTPLLIEIPYLFCNRRNLMAMKKRLSFKYLWSKIWNRNNQVGGINTQTAISYIQSTHV